jgi:hypothetical protein
VTERFDSVHLDMSGRSARSVDRGNGGEAVPRKPNLKRHADTERPRPDRTEPQTSRKTGSVIRPGEGGLTGMLSACRS